MYGLSIDAIAARTDVCRRLALAAIRLSESDSLITVQERRHEGREEARAPECYRLLEPAEFRVSYVIRPH